MFHEKIILKIIKKDEDSVDSNGVFKHDVKTINHMNIF